MTKKGVVDVITIVVVSAVVFLASLASIAIPLFVLRVHFVETIIFEYRYDSAQQALLMLMSLTEKDSVDDKLEPVSQIVGKNLALSENKPDLSFLKEELDKMVDHGIFNCYKLSAEMEVLAKLDCTNPNHEASKYTATMKIATPGMGKKLTLAIE